MCNAVPEVFYTCAGGTCRAVRRCPRGAAHRAALRWSGQPALAWAWRAPCTQQAPLTLLTRHQLGEPWVGANLKWSGKGVGWAGGRGLGEGHWGSTECRTAQATRRGKASNAWAPAKEPAVLAPPGICCPANCCSKKVAPLDLQRPRADRHGRQLAALLAGISRHPARSLATGSHLAEAVVHQHLLAVLELGEQPNGAACSAIRAGRRCWIARPCGPRASSGLVCANPCPTSFGYNSIVAILGLVYLGSLVSVRSPSNSFALATGHCCRS